MSEQVFGSGGNRLYPHRLGRRPAFLDNETGAAICKSITYRLKHDLTIDLSLQPIA